MAYILESRIFLAHEVVPAFIKFKKQLEQVRGNKGDTPFILASALPFNRLSSLIMPNDVLRATERCTYLVSL